MNSQHARVVYNIGTLCEQSHEKREHRRGFSREPLKLSLFSFFIKIIVFYFLFISWTIPIVLATYSFRYLFVY